MSKIIVKSSDGIMSLRDTRMYNPRSESSYMFRNNDEDETTYTGHEDGAHRDEMTEQKKKKRDDRKKEISTLRHIKVKPSDIDSVSDDDEQEEDEKLNREVEPSKLTGPPGNMGFLTSLATQAKGPGAAGGHAFATGEPMEIAFQLLKAYEDEHLQSYLDGDMNEMSMFGNSFDENRYPLLHMNVNHPMVQDHDDAVNELTSSNEGVAAYEPQLRETESDLKLLHDYMVLSRSPRGAPRQLSDPANDLLQNMRNQTNYHDMNHEELAMINMSMYMATLKALKQKNSQSSFDQSMMGDLKGNPIKIAFQLLKAKGHDERQGFIGKPKKEKKTKDKKVAIRAKKDKKERSKKWRPSTGQFKMPPGGMNPQSATGRRAKARMRGIKGAKKTGLSRAHLAVEMSHRGVKTKQPQSKDPRKYRQYMGQQEGRKRLGGVRTVSSQPARFGARSYSAGPTGAGMLQGRGQMVRRPALKPHRAPPLIPPQTPHAPTLPQLAMPSPPPISQPSRGVAVQGMAAQGPMFNPSRVPTSSVQGVMTGPIGEGSELQKKGLSYYDITELRQLVIEARRALKNKESKKKGKGTGDTSGGGSNLPAHSENGPLTSTKPEGATEDETDARRFGINPLDLYTSRGGRTP